jgi:hypothetical protein
MEPRDINHRWASMRYPDKPVDRQEDEGDSSGSEVNRTVKDYITTSEDTDSEEQADVYEPSVNEHHFKDFNPPSEHQYSAKLKEAVGPGPITANSAVRGKRTDGTTWKGDKEHTGHAVTKEDQSGSEGPIGYPPTKLRPMTSTSSSSLAPAGSNRKFTQGPLKGRDFLEVTLSIGKDESSSQQYWSTKSAYNRVGVRAITTEQREYVDWVDKHFTPHYEKSPAWGFWTLVARVKTTAKDIHEMKEDEDLQEF